MPIQYAAILKAEKISQVFEFTDYEPSKISSNEMNVRFILPITIRKHCSLLQTIEGIYFGLVRMYLTLYRISWIIFTSDLGISCTDKLLVF